MSHDCDRLMKGVAALALAIACGVSSAGIQPVGDPIPGNSWSQLFDYATGASNEAIDLVTVAITKGGPFESPAFRNFSVPGWENVRLEPPADSLTLALGNTQTTPVTALSFELCFDAKPEDSLSLLFSAWHPGESLPFEAYSLDWTLDPYWGGEQARGHWAVAAVSPAGPTRVELMVPIVPAPGAIALGALGLGLVSLLMRRA